MHKIVMHACDNCRCHVFWFNKKSNSARCVDCETLRYHNPDDKIEVVVTKKLDEIIALLARVVLEMAELSASVRGKKSP